MLEGSNEERFINGGILSKDNLVVTGGITILDFR